MARLHLADLSKQAIEALTTVLIAQQDYPQMVQDAAQAGITQDVAAIEDVTARQQAITAVVTEANAMIQELTPQVAEASEDCRSHA